MLGATMREAAGIRRFAAAALDLAYVAAGRFAAFFEFGLAPWDLAAGGLLVHEAGGQVTTPSGGTAFLDSGDVLATNGRLHEPMRDLLRASATGPGDDHHDDARARTQELRRVGHERDRERPRRLGGEADDAAKAR